MTITLFTHAKDSHLVLHISGTYSQEFIIFVWQTLDLTVVWSLTARVYINRKYYELLLTVSQRIAFPCTHYPTDR